MDRDEVLKMGRKENCSGASEFVQNYGRKCGVLCLFIATCVLGFYNGCMQLGMANYVVCAMFLLYLGGQSYGFYKITRKKIELVKTIVGIGMGVGAVILYIIKTSR